jgi:hypothetical protein
MPLQLRLDRRAETGDDYPSAVWRVDALAWNRADQRLDVTVGVYRDAAALAAKQPVVTRVFTAVGAEANQILAAADLRPPIYQWLKSRSEFAGAVDV